MSIKSVLIKICENKYFTRYRSYTYFFALISCNRTVFRYFARLLQRSAIISFRHPNCPGDTNRDGYHTPDHTNWTFNQPYPFSLSLPFAANFSFRLLSFGLPNQNRTEGGQGFRHLTFHLSKNWPLADYSNFLKCIVDSLEQFAYKGCQIKMVK